MKLKVESILKILSMVLFILTCLQLVMVVVNSIFKLPILNSVLHFNIYIGIFLIILKLMLMGGIEHFLVLLFYVCFFVFLMGQKLFMKEKNVFLTFVRTELNTSQYLTFLTIMSIGIFLTYYAYLFFYKSKKDTTKIYNNKYSKEQMLKVIRIMFFVTLPFALYMQLKIVIVRSSMSYTDGYLVNVYVPAIIKIAYYLFTCFSLVYLALKPSKKEMIFVAASILIIEGGVQLFQGRRAFFATTLLFLIWYLIKYFNVSKINVKYIISFFVGGLLLVVLFYFVEMFRSENGMGSGGIFHIIKKFMISTGGSDSVIANTIVNKEKFSQNRILYLLDPVINNPIMVILTGKSGISQGYEHINNFNDFSNWISYITEESLYISGHGMGSSYLAEVYFAFGITGVIIISIILGYIISCLSLYRINYNIFKSVVFFCLVKNLFTLPRSGLLSWFSEFTYICVGLCLILPFYVFCVKRYKKENNNEL